MIFEEVNIFGHVCNLLLYFCELGLYVFEVGLEVHYLLSALVLFGLDDSFPLFQHNYYQIALTLNSFISLSITLETSNRLTMQNESKYQKSLIVSFVEIVVCFFDHANYLLVPLVLLQV